MHDDDFETSDPCFAHLMIGGHMVDPCAAKDVARFRKAERQRLYAMRKTVTLDERSAASAMISRLLDEELGSVRETTIGVYWPIRGEIDLREWMAQCHEKGARLALPVVVERSAPVEFHKWYPDCPMRAGVWKIPVPAASAPVVPDVVIAPLLGVDRQRFRLGNGGGYYDRTFAAFTKPVRRIGVGQEFCRMESIFPMPWDIPMDRVLLDDGTTY